jgi:phosphatidylserine decarboxylase
VFAPQTGRFLLPVLLLLLLLSGLVGIGYLPRSLEFALILAIGYGYWAFFAAFFRDPERTAGSGIVAPADGRVLAIERDDEQVRLAIFMNVTDVHVNRFPIAGRVEGIETSGEGFRPAYVPDARHNLQRRYTLSTSLGTVEVIQMTGLIARRLVSFVGVGAARSKGDRLGMIVLGSRVDLILPTASVRIRVNVGDRVRAGVTTVAEERS